jgi:ABC transport system ATP-binding/permease protein
MSLISAHDVVKGYGSRTVLDKVSVTIEPGDRLGLIGVNGAGKSTLLKILLGIEEADHGVVQRKRELTWGMVTQAPELDPTATVLELVRRGQAQHQALKERLDGIGKAIEAAKDEAAQMELVHEQAALTERLDRLGGFNVVHHAEAVMAALGVPPGDRLAGSLSLGEQRRVALATAILSGPELLVLDEPTNHIDVEAIEWLEENLVEWPGALVLVTHDRWFLDRVANRHAELDRGDLRLYEGNYSEYLAAKAEREAMEQKTEHKRQRAIESELHWVRRRAPARTTKQRARLERFDEMVANRPKSALGEAAFRLPHPPRLGNTILELKGVKKSLGGKTLIAGLDLGLKKGDRLGIVGPNGAGKTTLLRMIKGELTPDAGEIVQGTNTAIAYADQRRILDDKNSVLEEVAGDNDTVWIGDQAISVHTFLDGLLFDGAAQRTKIAALSGGERSRVALAKALRVTANVLILDEPTNDLDLLTLRVLEDALIEYPGCALVVSHDRYFLDRISTAILAFEGNGKITLYEGSYDSFRKRLAPPAPSTEPVPKAAPAAAKPKASDAPKKRTFNEEKEFAGMEEKILAAESEVEALEKEVSDPATLRALGAEVKAKLATLDAKKKQIEALYQRWAELSALPPR